MFVLTETGSVALTVSLAVGLLLLLLLVIGGLMCWIRKTRPGKRYEQHVPPVVIYIICCVICALAPLRISLQIPSVGLRTIQPVVSVGQRARQPQARPRAHQPAAVRGVFGYPGLQTSVLSQTHDCRAEAQ